jgi:hypothetical protein
VPLASLLEAGMERGTKASVRKMVKKVAAVAKNRFVIGNVPVLIPYH